MESSVRINRVVYVCVPWTFLCSTPTDLHQLSTAIVDTRHTLTNQVLTRVLQSTYTDITTAVYKHHLAYAMIPVCTRPLTHQLAT